MLVLFISSTKLTEIYLSFIDIYQYYLVLIYINIPMKNNNATREVPKVLIQLSIQVIS